MTTHALQTLPPLAVGAQQPATIDPTLDLCTRYPFMAGWTKAVWNTKFAQLFCTWPALGIEPQTFWSWVQCPIHLVWTYFISFTWKGTGQSTDAMLKPSPTQHLSTWSHAPTSSHMFSTCVKSIWWYDYNNHQQVSNTERYTTRALSFHHLNPMFSLTPKIIGLAVMPVCGKLSTT